MDGGEEKVQETSIGRDIDWVCSLEGKMDGRLLFRCKWHNQVILLMEEILQQLLSHDCVEVQ